MSQEQMGGQEPWGCGGEIWRQPGCAWTALVAADGLIPFQ